MFVNKAVNITSELVTVETQLETRGTSCFARVHLTCSKKLTRLKRSRLMRNEEKGLITSTPVEILIMAPGHHQVVEATLGLVHSVLGAEKKE
jgi:hypothetical protein